MADFQHIRLKTKPTAQICFSLQGNVSATNPLLTVFVNGLGLPQAGWMPAIAQLKELRDEAEMPCILTYDRFGQGQTVDRDPRDSNATDPSHGHDCMNAVQDLRQLIAQIGEEFLGISDVNTIRLVVVCNSIGGAIVRLYAQHYPGTVAGILFLDSVLANSDFVSIFPDPDAADFSASTLPHGVTVQSLREAREGVRRIFHPDVGNKEGLSRKNLRALLPQSDSPKLSGVGGHGPIITVVGHEFEAFAEESAKMGRPKELTMEYVNPHWDEYNKGLARLTEPNRSKGPLQAPNCGHFIQKDNPAFVARELDELLGKVASDN